MDKEQSERKEFLQEQLQRTKEQIGILDQMDMKLQEMKRIAESAVGNDLSMVERESLNRRLEVLKHEYDLLEKRKKIVLHWEVDESNLKFFYKDIAALSTALSQMSSRTEVNVLIKKIR